jgi:hypothetical protein
MKVTKEWIDELARKYGKRSKEVRDALWPDTPTKSLTYLNGVQNMGVQTAITIADVLGCSVDELLRRPTPSTALVSGNNNHVGNVSISNDPDTLLQIISAQKQIITHQEAEIKRMEQSTKEQLKVKDQQISELGKRIDRLIELANEK